MSHDEEDSEPKGWRINFGSLFLLAVIVALASGWVLTVVEHRKELRKLRSQLERERQQASQVFEYVYMTTSDEETKKKLLSDWQKAVQVHRDN